ncbi:MAG: hypothetical protein ABR969_06595 [Sedimentisphaerales bacterium]|jgi:hypothetical protein
MKLAGLVLLGLIASIALGAIPGFLIMKAYPKTAGDDAYLWIPAFITMPIGFFLGSIVTGYFSYYEIEKKWKLIWLSPVLYILLLWTCRTGVVSLLDSFTGVNQSNQPASMVGLLIPFLMGLLWFLSSLAGIGLGYFLRDRIVNWWYRD